MSFAWHALPSFSCWDGLLKRTLDIAIQCKKHDWTVFITFLFPFILFSLWFASTYFTIINHPFRLPRAGAHWFTSCCSLGWSEKHKSWKMQKVGVDSKPHHITDFRKKIRNYDWNIRLARFWANVYYITFTLYYNRKMAKMSPKINKIETWPKLRPKVINSWNLSRREHIRGMFEL